MKLKNGYSRKTFEYNVAELIKAGKTKQQAFFMAFAIKNKAKQKLKRKKQNGY